MTVDVAVVDYGMGNLHSVIKALEYWNFSVERVSRPDGLKGARGLILPGVGAFGQARQRLAETGLDEAILEEVKAGKPLLGICLGLQLLFQGGDEGGWHDGLGLLPGIVERFPAGLPVPHMGWNQIHWQESLDLLANIPQESSFYFVHSFFMQPQWLQGTPVAVTEYGRPVLAAVERPPLYGTQFHPEKSGRLGLAILHNFGVICR